MDTSIFAEKNKIPSDSDLTAVLGCTFSFWQQIRDYTLTKYPKAEEEWNYPGTKYGWSFRMKDKKRAILYLLPRKSYFKVAFVFGTKAYENIMNSQVSASVKQELESAKAYAEGRGIRIDVKNDLFLSDIKYLIDIKLAN